MKLRKALRNLLADWKEDLPGAWRSVLGGIQLNWKSSTLDHELLPGEIILPGRKKSPLCGAPKGAHFLRAFERTDPGKVRAVVMGQDPYPNRVWATGRAFEQGNLKRWPYEPSQVAESLRRIVQAIVVARTGDRSYAASDHAWTRLAQDACTGSLQLQPPGKLFDHLENEGVLFLNTSLTIGVVERKGARKQCSRHFQLWAPFIQKVLLCLAARRSGHIVFILLGRQAAQTFDRSGVELEAGRAGTSKRRVDAVRHYHPAAITAKGPVFLSSPNPFCAANELLLQMGAAPISW